GLAKESGGPVLELGCGSGRVTQQIARAGITIVGLDNSEPMLALARAKLNRKSELAARATLVCGDMTNFNLDQQFSLIIVPFNTFMHLLTMADQLAMLNCSRKHLITGGSLVLDLTNPAPAYADPPTETLTHERTFRDDVNDLTIQQFSTIRLDRTAQIAHIIWHYDSIAVDDTMKRTLVPLTLRYTFPAEMGLLLERSGFRLVHLYGDYDESSLDDES
ncbi:MAG: class I SAM-dependent methyltransferase, partial [Chloroflexota bacterium]